MPTPIDSASIWLSQLLLEKSGEDADRAVLGQMEADLNHRSLDEAIALLDDAGREQPGEFGLEYLAFLHFPLVMPAVHEFIKVFAKKFCEGAASETGKMTATALKNRIGNVLGNVEGEKVKQQAVADLERCFAERAKAMDLPKSSYEDLLREVRNNPRMFL